MREELLVVGKNLPKFDATDKAIGKARYCIDLNLDEMLYAKLLRSPYPHAKVIDINISKAEKYPGVRAITTIFETPKVVGAIGHLTTAKGRESLIICDNVVRFIGDPIAAVAADNEKIAEEALSLIEIKYDILSAIFDPAESLKTESIKIHKEGNIPYHFVETFGDVNKSFKEADYILQNTYTTSKQKHAALEPFGSCIAYFDSNERLTVYSSSQRPHIIKLYLARALDIPMNKVRIIKPYTGGAFGGRDYLIHGLEVMCSFLSRKCGKTVKMSFTREEDFEATESRHPFIIDLKTGVNKDGILAAIDVHAVMNVGAYGAHAVGVIRNAMTIATLLYRCPVRFEGSSVYTNTSLCGAFRSYGNPQINFALESQMDIIAEKLNLDPVELRLKNYRGLGEVDPVGGLKIQSDGMKECLLKGSKKFGWKGKWKGKIRNIRDGVLRRGVGMSCLVHPSGARFAIPDPAAAIVMLNTDGSVNLVTAAADDGQGNRTVLAQIAAEELGTNLERISISAVDTDTTPIDSGTHASRQTYAGGIAVRQAALDAKNKLLSTASQKLNIEPTLLNIKNGEIYEIKRPANKISVADLLTSIEFEDKSNCKQVIGVSTGVAPGWAPTYGANFAEVEVDTDTGEVKVIKMVFAFDVGKAINPAHVEGQILGGEMQGVGYALTEDLIMNSGKICNSNFTDYRVLRACDIPDFDIIIVESNEPTGAFGAKGIGEATNAGTAAAIANAIYDATGVRIMTLPITQEKVLKGLDLMKEQNITQ
jgi:xanthine dehydrogenase molybdenum-binding subunit